MHFFLTGTANYERNAQFSLKRLRNDKSLLIFAQSF